MHGVIHRNKVEARAGSSGVSIPAKEKDGDVMVPVKEDERLLAQHDEDGVNQLWDFGKDEKHNPKSGRSRAPGFFWLSANCFFERTS